MAKEESANSKYSLYPIDQHLWAWSLIFITSAANGVSQSVFKKWVGWTIIEKENGQCKTCQSVFIQWCTISYVMYEVWSSLWC